DSVYRVRVRDVTSLYITNSSTAPTSAPRNECLIGGWISNWCGGNTTLPSVPLTYAPTMPRTAVAIQPMGCLPGTTARAIRPTTRPRTINQTMCRITTSSFG